MRSKADHFLSAATLSLAFLALTACGGGSSPVATTKANFNALADGKVSKFLETSTSKTQMEEMRKEWETFRKKKPAPDEAMQFQGTMAMLTAKDAEKELFNLVQPQLAELSEQAAGMAVMLPAFAGGLTGPEAAPARDFLTSFAGRIKGLELSDETKAKAAIKVLVSAARDLDVSSLDALNKLEFDAMLRKADRAFKGVGDFLEVYGLSLEDTFKSVDAELIDKTDNTAKLKMSYSLFGGPKQTSEIEMHRVDGRWVATGR